METVIIGEELFKENSPVTDGVVIKEFLTYLSIAQKLYIERVLGTPLLEEVQEQVRAAREPDAPPDAITPENQALIKTVAPALAYYAVYLGLPFHWAKVLNRGITIAKGDQNEAVDKDGLAMLQRQARETAEQFKQNLIAYLCRCRGSYPKWRPDTGCGCGCDDKENAGSARVEFDAGIYIPKKR